MKIWRTRQGLHTSQTVADKDQSSDDSYTQNTDHNREYRQRQPIQLSRFTALQRRCNDNT